MVTVVYELEQFNPQSGKWTLLRTLSDRDSPSVLPEPLRAAFTEAQERVWGDEGSPVEFMCDGERYRLTLDSH